MRASLFAVWESTKLAFATLLANRFRSFLTVLGIFIGTLTLRHGDHHALLLERGWEEIEVEELRDRELPRA